MPTGSESEAVSDWASIVEFLVDRGRALTEQLFTKKMNLSTQQSYHK